jgi:hypothetical protein
MSRHLAMRVRRDLPEPLIEAGTLKLGRAEWLCQIKQEEREMVVEMIIESGSVK